jgi:hypothetical protein
VDNRAVEIGCCEQPCKKMGGCGQPCDQDWKKWTAVRSRLKDEGTVRSRLEVVNNRATTDRMMWTTVQSKSDDVDNRAVKNGGCGQSCD